MDNHFRGSSAYALLNTTQDTFGHLCCQHTLLVHAQPPVPQDAQVLYCRDAPQAAGPQAMQLHRVLFSQVQSFAFALAEFRKIPVSLFRSLWMAALPSSVSTSPFQSLCSTSCIQTTNLKSF